MKTTIIQNNLRLFGEFVLTNIRYMQIDKPSLARQTKRFIVTINGVTQRFVLTDMFKPSDNLIVIEERATNRKFKTQSGEQKEEVMFIDITFFGRSAEIANQYLRKGSKILVEGRLTLDQWDDPTTGQKRSRHSVTVDTMQMLDTRQQNQEPPVHYEQYRQH